MPWILSFFVTLFVYFNKNLFVRIKQMIMKLFYNDSTLKSLKININQLYINRCFFSERCSGNLIILRFTI